MKRHILWAIMKEKETQMMEADGMAKHRKTKGQWFKGLQTGIIFVLLLCFMLFGALSVKKSFEAGGSQASVYDALQNWAQNDKKAENIYKHKDEYPESLLKKLMNNPEMLDFVEGYLQKASQEPVLTQEEKTQKNPLFLQWDRRWGYADYGDDNIGLSGCGPTCVAMVLFSLTRNEQATPFSLAEYAQKHGYYVAGQGTAWSFMTDVPSRWGLSVETVAKSEENLKQAIGQGRILIASMLPGAFTSSGHFIVIYGCSDEGFLVNDPNSRQRSQKTWSYRELENQFKNIWSYGL